LRPRNGESRLSTLTLAGVSFGVGSTACAPTIDAEAAAMTTATD
jgi:hypothetical protein